VDEFIRYLGAFRGWITTQEIRTLRGKAKIGDTLAVRKGLVTILRKQGLNVSLGRW
jgi:hypothetical protein